MEFSKFKLYVCIKEVYISELNDLITKFFGKIYRFDVLFYHGYFLLYSKVVQVYVPQNSMAPQNIQRY